MNNIILCGFMGCGKSTVGQILADDLSKRFIDMDSYIQDREKLTINEIFERYGEEYFRELEHEACKELKDMSGLVVASGGGALTFRRNADIFRKNDTVFFIDVPLDEIKKRLKGDDTRPLFKDGKKASLLYDKRYKYYAEASDYIIKGIHTPKQTAALIRDIYKNL